jgi:L-asparaginase
MKQLILTTGGTFDKAYDAITGELGFTETHIPQIIREANIYSFEYELKEIMRVDSLVMTELQRYEIADCCAIESYANIVIVHGTDTMVETAKVIGSCGLPKTIILTGAMRCFEFKETDADTNLIAALTVAPLLPHGVFICMGGAIFPYNNVKKDRKIGQFSAINEAEWRNWQVHIFQKNSLMAI